VGNDLINYQYSAIADGVRQMQQVNQNIQQQVQDLQAQVKALLSDFAGTSAQSYDTCANKISSDLTQSNEQLATLSRQVNSGSENMHSADASQARRFGR